MTTDTLVRLPALGTETLPAVNHSDLNPSPNLGDQIQEAYHAWLARSPSRDTRSNYERDVRQFLAFAGVAMDRLEDLTRIRPLYVSQWRDELQARGLKNASVRRKMTAVRALFSFLQSYGYTGKNPAHGDLAAAPAVARDGKTVGLSPEQCRRLLEGPRGTMTRALPDGGTEEVLLPAAIRDRALLAILAYTGCRVGELTRLKVSSYRGDGVHKVLEIHGKGGKERVVPLHPEAAERLEAWLDTAAIRGEPDGALFRPAVVARGQGKSGFAARAMTRRAVQRLVKEYAKRLGLDRHVSVHSLRVTALTTARENGSDILDLQEFAGHADPRTTLTYIRSRDRLSKSPAYVLRY